MTDEELYRCRCDLAERGFPADDWSDAEIEALPEWIHVPHWSDGYALLVLIGNGTHGEYVECPMIDGQAVRYPENILMDVEFMENSRPTNRLAILHLLPQPQTYQQAETP